MISTIFLEINTGMKFLLNPLFGSDTINYFVVVSATDAGEEKKD